MLKTILEPGMEHTWRTWSSTAWTGRRLTSFQLRYRVSQQIRPFLKIENIPDLLTEDKKGKIIEKIS